MTGCYYTILNSSLEPQTSSNPPKRGLDSRLSKQSPLYRVLTLYNVSWGLLSSTGIWDDNKGFLHTLFFSNSLTNRDRSTHSPLYWARRWTGSTICSEFSRYVQTRPLVGGTEGWNKLVPKLHPHENLGLILGYYISPPVFCRCTKVFRG